MSEEFDNIITLIEHLTTTYENELDQLEEKGWFAASTYYDALIAAEESKRAQLTTELEELTEAFSAAMNSGEIDEYSESWYSMQQQINDVKEAIQDCDLALLEYENDIRDLDWEIFDYIEDRISAITTEADFLIDLLDNADLFEENGQLTDEGQATMALHGTNYNIYMAQADAYAQEIQELNELLEDDPYDQELIERKQELYEAQQDCISAAEDEKDAMIELVEEGIETELDYLQSLIDTYEDALDSAKDLYDYQKKISEQTAEIASLEKQLSAYSGDTSEETRATVQQLKVQLEEAQSDLEETEYEQYISDQKKLLDELYTEYELILNQRLDDIDQLITDLITDINLNADTISATITSATDSVGYTLSDSMQTIWGDASSALTDSVSGISTVLSTYGENFGSQLTTVNEALSNISAYVADMVGASEEEATATVATTTSTTTPTTTSTATTSTSTSTASTANTSSSTNFSDEIKKGVAAAIWIYGSSASGWGSGSTRKSRLTEKFGSTNASAIQSYINSHGSNGDLYKYWANSGYSNLSQYYYKAFKSGGLADYTGMAWLDGTPSAPEMVLSASDTENFISLKDALAAIASKGISFDSTNSSGIYDGVVPSIPSNLLNGNSGTGDIGQINVSIAIDHVEDYDDIVNRMRSDDTFEKMVQSMTVDLVSGGSALSKYKYKW